MYDAGEAPSLTKKRLRRVGNFAGLTLPAEAHGASGMVRKERSGERGQARPQDHQVARPQLRRPGRRGRPLRLRPLQRHPEAREGARRFLTKHFVLTHHRRIIELLAGTPGVPDKALLGSARAQPGAKLGGENLHCGVAAMASAYAFHVSTNNPLVDGNKRMASICIGVFLDPNGSPPRD